MLKSTYVWMIQRQVPIPFFLGLECRVFRDTISQGTTKYMFCTQVQENKCQLRIICTMRVYCYCNMVGEKYTVLAKKNTEQQIICCPNHHISQQR
jgi:predicted class III extradiol MEMO1 family dioxygenase